MDLSYEDVLDATDSRGVVVLLTLLRKPTCLDV